MPPRPTAHIETIEISSDDDDDMAGLQLLNGHQAPQLPTLGRLDTPVLDDDSDWRAVLNLARELETTEDAELHRTTEITEDDCLARILEIYPDISHEHVLELFRAKREAGKEANASLCDELIVEILDANDYPKQRQARRENLKRKYRASSEESNYNGPSEDNAQGSRYKELGHHFLLQEFPYVPKRFVTTTLADKKSVFQAYLAIEEAERQYSATDRKDRPYRRVGKLRKEQHICAPQTDATVCSVKREMAGAKKKVEKDSRKREEEHLKALAEERNEAAARANNDMTECGCCFGEYPTNRMTFCNGEQLHFFCHGCANMYVSNEIGQRKCRPKCMDTGGCDAEFSRGQLKAFLDDKVFETLERLQQQEDLRNAGIEDLDECPFCDFKMICAPKLVDREFRCLNEDCAVVSCRLCRQETHVPFTCEQASKDKKIDVRHKVEEAMTAALIRECNNCKNKFIKDYGCNKMTCTSCRNLQCYVCSKNVKDYHHFGAKPGQCPLYENTEQRHEEEVQKAEKAAFEELKKENPNMAEEDLKIQVSEAVKKADKERIERGARHPGAQGYPGNVYAPHFGVPANPAQIPLPENPRDRILNGAPCPCEGLLRMLDGIRAPRPDWLPHDYLRIICRCGRFGDRAPANRPPHAAPGPYMGAPAVQAQPQANPVVQRFREWRAGRLGPDPALRMHHGVPPQLAQDIPPEVEPERRGWELLFPDMQLRMRELEARNRYHFGLPPNNMPGFDRPPHNAHQGGRDPQGWAQINRQANQAMVDAQDLIAARRHRPR
ncbi:hypothetical protein IWX90DRAFT_228017 [Phyllosticta citrichinensis]|uniref:RING-type domain-containing protein n=1 Tax=Phyllosticta citrichinensis TaxID=1130410 RepID=A0ABR1XUT5_9PEZI